MLVVVASAAAPALEKMVASAATIKTGFAALDSTDKRLIEAKPRPHHYRRRRRSLPGNLDWDCSRYFHTLLRKK